jgi:hypothetical protein
VNLELEVSESYGVAVRVRQWTRWLMNRVWWDMHNSGEGKASVSNPQDSKRMTQHHEPSQMCT